MSNTINEPFEGGFGYTEDQVKILNNWELARRLVDEAWLAALQCHARHGMAGWSIYGEAYKESVVHNVLGP